MMACGFRWHSIAITHIRPIWLQQMTDLLSASRKQLHLLICHFRTSKNFEASVDLGGSSTSLYLLLIMQLGKVGCVTAH